MVINGKITYKELIHKIKHIYYDNVDFTLHNNGSKHVLNPSSYK